MITIFSNVVRRSFNVNFSFSVGVKQDFGRCCVYFEKDLGSGEYSYLFFESVEESVACFLKKRDEYKIGNDYECAIDFDAAKSELLATYYSVNEKFIDDLDNESKDLLLLLQLCLGLCIIKNNIMIRETCEGFSVNLCNDELEILSEESFENLEDALRRFIVILNMKK